MPTPPPLTLVTHPISALEYLGISNGFGARQLVTIGSNLYYFTRSQIGVAENTNKIQVFKSSDRITWTKVVDAFPDTVYNCQPVVVGSKVYIGYMDNSAAPIVRIRFHVFDTTTDSFLSDSSVNPDNQGGAGQTTQTYTVLNNGNVLVVSTKALAQGGHTFAYIYNTAGDTWSAGVDLGEVNSQVYAQVHDPVTDLTFCFLVDSAQTHLRCVTLTAGLLFTDVLVATAVTTFNQHILGSPTISTGLNEVVIPFLPSTFGDLKIARATVAATPTFTIDTVQTIASLPDPVNQYIGNWDQQTNGSAVAYDLNGILYIFYQITNGADSGSSQTYLYYKSSQAVGSFDPVQIGYTGTAGREMMPLFIAANGSVNPVIMIGLIDPTIWPAYASLSNVLLYYVSSPVVVSSVVNIDATTLPYVGLPNPTRNC